MTDLANIVIRVDSSQLNTATGATEQLRRGTLNLLGSLDRVASAQISHANAVKTLQSAVRANIITQQEMLRATDALTQRLEAQGLTLNRLGEVVQRNTGVFRRFGSSGMQQVGYQVGDFAVQVQGGTNALVALGQQGTQLLGIFGPAGAIAGAFFAIGTAILNVVLQTEKFKNASDNLKTGISELRSEIKLLQSGAAGISEEFGKVSTGLERTVRLIATVTLAKVMGDARTQLEALTKDMYTSTATIMNSTIWAQTAGSSKGYQSNFGMGAEQANQMALNELALARAATDKERLDLLNQMNAELEKQVISGAVISDQGLAYIQSMATVQQNLQTAVNLQGELADVSKEELITSKEKEQYLIRSYQYMGETMRQSAAQVASYEKENGFINDKLVMEVAIAKFGKDSAEVKKMQLQEQLDLYNQGIDKQVLLGVYSEAQGAALKDANLIRVEAVALQQEEIDALNKGKELVRELLSTYLDIDKAVDDISKIDLKAVFEDAVPASSALYQFVSDTYNTMLNMSKFQPQDYSGFVYGGMLAEGRMAGSSFPPVDKKTIDSVKQYGSSVNKATKELTAAEKAAKEFADSMQGYVVGAVQSVSDAFGDFVMRGFKDFKGFKNSILSSFTSMLAQMISLAARNQIMISMGMGGAGMVAGGAAAAATGGMGGLGGIATGIGVAGGAIGGGLLAGAGLAINGGMAGIVGGVTGGLSAFTSGIGAIGSVAGAGSMALGGLATAIGAIALPIAAVVAVFSFFKKKTKELDSGLRITVNNMDALVETFKKTETKRFWGLSRKTSSSTVAASSEIADPIENAVSAIQNSIVDMAGALNIGSEAFDNFYFQLKVSLKGLSAEEATAKIQEELMKVGDAMAEMIPDLVALSQGSETASETLVRLYTSLQVANAYFGPLIDTLFQASLAGADLASTMVQAFGSVDAFNSNMAFFAENFYTQAEQITWASDRINKAFTDLGMTAPATADAFRILVEDLMKATTSGVEGAAEQLAAVLAVQQDMLAVSVYEAEQAAEAQRLAIQLGEEATRLEAQLASEAVRAAEEAAQEAIRTAEEKATLEIQLLEAQGKAVEALKLQREAELAALDESNRAILQQIFDLEDLNAAQELAAQAAQAASEIAEEVAQKAERIAQERYDLESKLLELQGNTIELRSRELAILDPTNRALQQMIWGLEDAKVAMEAINEIDFATKVDYLRAVGVARGGIAGFAAGGMHSGGARIVGENGPELEVTGPSRIYSKQDTSNMFRDPDLASAVQGLRNEVSGMRSEQLQLQVEISKNTKRVYDVERKWDIDGLPPVRV